ncbi:MAG TPA: Uma2 family endonuclease [Kamptonema sp.]|nr:Uma2 family endonuclease [Kamptonema sp.]
MIANPEFRYMTPQEYLEWEEQQPLKYEYVNGEAFAMIGGTIPHTAIALNLASALKNHLRDKGCKVLMADAKVMISENGPFHYPDVVVTCDERDRRAIQFIQYPCLIVEVLSPGTEGYDRGKKFTHYRRINTLREYVLINAEEISVDCYRLNEQNKWELTNYQIDETTPEGTEPEVHLTSVDFRCPISLLYEDVEITTADPKKPGFLEKSPT